MFLKRCVLNIVGVIIFTLFFGCSTPEAIQPKVFDTVIILNSTGKHIQKVSISGASSKGNIRFGSISPVPKNSKQEFIRSDKAKRLPDTLIVSWIDSTNTIHQMSLSIASLLTSSSPNKSRTIVLEFNSDAIVRAHDK